MMLEPVPWVMVWSEWWRVGDIRDGWRERERERAVMKARPGDSPWRQTMALFVAVNESGKLRGEIISLTIVWKIFISL